MRRHLEPTIWFAALVSAGVGVVVLGIATAPAQTGGDWWDSKFLLPMTLALGVLSIGAGYRVPRLWAALGLSAMAPYYAAQLGFGIRSTLEEGDGLWLAGLIFLVPLTAIPVGAAWIGSKFGRRRSAALP